MERLGEVTVPSGTLTVLDPGHIGMFTEEQIPSVPVVEIEGLPTDRPLPVMGERVAKGRWRGCWDHVEVLVADAPATSSEEIGEAMVDFARLLLADSTNASRWVHSDSMDGRADFVFWGRDAEVLAKATGAPALDEGNYGWKDLPVDECVEKGTAAEELKEERGWKLATDFRPHSHHWALLEQVRGSPTESGTLDVEDLRVCLFMTSWGDGVFPILVDRAADGSLVRIRIQLRTPDSEGAMAAVNDEEE
jgi:hypothetical protein